MNKTITINPDLFRFTNNRTMRKRKTNSDAPEIKVRAPPKDNSKTVSKHHVLRFIRDQQEKNYRKLSEGAQEPTNPKDDQGHNQGHSQAHNPPPAHVPVADNFNSDFQESLKYLSALSDQVEKKTPTKHNQTLRNYNQSTPQSLLFHPSPAFLSTGQPTANRHLGVLPNQNENVSLDIPAEFSLPLPSPETLAPVMTLTPPPRIPAVNPSWGCLKGGTLPTYRAWNRTQRNHPLHNNQTTTVPPTFMQRPMPPPPPLPQIPTVTVQPSTASHFSHHQMTQPLTKPSRVEIMQTMKQIADEKSSQKQKMRYPKHKRTVRRTYRVGKSKIHPKVTVLISNKTLRSQITTKTQTLKQTPIDEVKRFLTKKGFIRVGSTAPNDVLRKMYETACLVCGEIQNHNPDNLLYNFLNDGSSH